MAVSLIALLALGVAGFSLLRLSRLPERAPPVDERTFENLGQGDVLLVPDGEWLVAGRESIGEGPLRSALFALRSGRLQRWLLVPETGPLALLGERPGSPDLERAAAAPGAVKLDRATVELLPGA